MKNILILSNFEPHSINATTYAMHFFSGQSCHFYFLNIVKVWEYTTDNLITASEDETLYDTILSSSKTKLDTKIAFLKETYTHEDYTFTDLLDYDVFTDAIKQAVKNHDIDCIIMGSNGQSNFIEKIFGSHSTRVIRKVNCPVFIIPENYVYEPIHNVLLILDKDTTYTTHVFDKAFKIIDRKTTRVSVLRLSSSEPLYQKEEMHQIEKDFDQNNIPYFHLSQHTENKGKQLQVVDEVLKTDINIVRTSPTSFTSRILKNTGIDDLILKIEKPTIFLKN